MNLFIENNNYHGAYYGRVCAEEILTATRHAKIYREKYYKLVEDIRQARMDKSIDKRELDKLNKRLVRNAVGGDSKFLRSSKTFDLGQQSIGICFDENLLYLRSDRGQNQIETKLNPAGRE